MNKIDAALRRFESFDLGPSAKLSPSQIDTVANWFATDFATAAASLIERSDFRVHARWTTDNLGKCSNSPTRKLLETVERALTETGSRLLSIATAASTRARFSGPKAEQEYETMLKWLTVVAQKQWRDLASSSDFYWPTAGLNLPQDFLSDRDLVPADLDPCLCTELHTPGDFVARCAIRRVGHWGEFLERSYVALGYRLGTTAEHDAALMAAMGNWIDPLYELRSVCLETGEARLREAIVSIVQLYSAWAPKADFRWLRLAKTDPLMAYELRRRVIQNGDRSIVETAASSLMAVTELNRSEPDIDLVIQEAAESHLLCVIDAGLRREVWWQGELLNVDWSKKSRAWKLLYALCEKRFGVSELNELGISLKDAKFVLKSVLPEALFALIGVERGVYRLEITRDQLFLARFKLTETLCEVG